jgi:hypothetical protein
MDPANQKRLRTPRIQRLGLTSSEKMTRSKPLAWTDLPTVLSGIAVFLTLLAASSTGLVFVVSCLYLSGLETAFGVSLTDYLEFNDYVTCLPIFVTSAGVILGVVVIVCVLMVLVAYRAMMHLPIYTRFIPTKSRNRDFAWIALTIVLVFIAIIISATLWTARTQGGDLKRDLWSVPISQVFLKSARPLIQGRLILHSGRYLFLFSKDYRLIVVPNVEVERIETSSWLSFVASTPTPVIVSPVKPLTPVQMSPTPMPK